MSLFDALVEDDLPAYSTRPYMRLESKKEKIAKMLNTLFWMLSCFRLYLNNLLRFVKSPVHCSSGCRIESFHVKVRLSY